jgi:poly-beta-1,6-N-acetyl-D-glucosamine synthase
MFELLNFLASALFLAGIFTLFYTYVGFPLTLKVIRDFKIREKALDNNLKGNKSTEQVDIQVIIPCFNEAKILERRIENILTQDYPRTRRSILVISDGSTDNTNEVIIKLMEHYADIVLYSLPNNIGKNNALNLAYESGYFTAEILCFTDADAEFDPGSLKSATKYFSDPQVGLVGGHLVYWPTSDSACQAEGVFRRLENFLRQMEGDLGWLVSAPGTFILMRRELYKPLSDQVNNDFAMPLSVLAQGYAAKFDKHALAISLFPASTQDVLDRRKRTVIRALTTLARYRSQLPWRLRLVLFWHKTVRFYGLPLQVAILTANASALALSQNRSWTILLVLQLSFYGLAFLGWLSERINVKLPLVHLPYQFTIQNFTTFTAVINYLYGQRVSKWTPHR